MIQRAGVASQLFTPNNQPIIPRNAEQSYTDRFPLFTNSYTLSYRSLQTCEAFSAPIAYERHATKSLEEFLRRIRVLSSAKSKNRRDEQSLFANQDDGNPTPELVGPILEMRLPRHNLIAF